jgi:hypothetical protein
MKLSIATVAFAIVAAATMPHVSAQAAPATSAPHVLRTYHLKYATTQAEQNEIMSALRNIGSPSVRIILVPSTNEIAVSATDEDIKVVEDLLTKIDVPHKLYRLTYTFTETDGGKRIGVQHYSMLLAPSQRMQMKEGSRIPIVIGTIGPDDAKPKQQTTYLDVGLNLDSQLDEYGQNGVRLRSKVEQSSIADKVSPGMEDPVIRQTVIEGNTVLTEGKPQTLGTLDVVDSTRHLEVEATVEVVR